jgi:hypothetical protein
MILMRIGIFIALPTDGFLEILDSFTQGLSELGQTTSSENDHDDQDDKEQFRGSDGSE